MGHTICHHNAFVREIFNLTFEGQAQQGDVL